MRETWILMTAVCLVTGVAMFGGSGGESREAVSNGLAGDPPAFAIDRQSVGLLLIDAQPSFVKMMAGDPEPVLARIEQCLVAADVASLPLIATFETPTARNGTLPERLEKLFPKHGRRFDKHVFDAMAHPEIRDAVLSWKVRQVVVAGAETDVCVMQTVFGLRRLGLQVFVLEDAVFSNEGNVRPAFDRMRAAGAVVTTFKSFYFELVRGVDRADIPASWHERIERLRDVERSPYQLPAFKPGW